MELAPSHRALYDTFLQRERQKLLGLIDDMDKNRFIVFRSLTLLRMLALDASLVDEKYSDIPSSKLEVLFEQLDDVVAEGHRALIFSQFTSFLTKAAAELDRDDLLLLLGQLCGHEVFGAPHHEGADAPPQSGEQFARAMGLVRCRRCDGFHIVFGETTPRRE